MKCKILIISYLSILASCSKNSFLSAKPDQSIAVPEHLHEFQAILDNDVIMNNNIDPNYLLVGSDDYYNTEERLALSPDQYEKNGYIWNDDIYNPDYPNDQWDKLFRTIFYANVVLEGIDKIINTSPQEGNKVKGSALFFRARMFYQLSQVYAPQYKKETAETDLGIVMRLKADVNEPIKRFTNFEVYNKIIQDFKSAAKLLSNLSESPYKTRPTKQAAFAMLAKTYLIMGEYENAFLYADSCLQIQNTLIDYKTLPDNEPNFPVPKAKNPEIIYFSTFSTSFAYLIIPSQCYVDSNLFQSYKVGDLRKKLFFGNISSKPAENFFKGSYDSENAQIVYFGGIAVDEIILIKAECLARINRVEESMSVLNTLLEHRWLDDGSMIPYETEKASEALQFILIERRKELVGRGTRWTDLRRLNLEGANIIPKRVMDGIVYELPPNDYKYTFLIPPTVIKYNSQMIQNPR